MQCFQDAWESVDIDGILACWRPLLTMPPERTRFDGASAIVDFFATVPLDGRLDRIRLVSTRANGQPALAAYAQNEETGAHDAYGVMVFAIEKTGSPASRASRAQYARSIATLVASWEAHTGGSEGAAVVASRGVAAAVFPPEPARSVYNVGELPAGLLDAVDDRPIHVLVAGLDGLSTGIAFDRDGDCGIYNVGTLAHARRRGLGTAVSARLVHDAAVRGCQTASLQSAEMAEPVYAAVGFRDLGRILEFVPG